jgi:hypothetical protein
MERSRRWTNVSAAMTAVLPLGAFMFLTPDGENTKARLQKDYR